MTTRGQPDTGDNEIAALREEIAALREHVDVLIDTMEAVREELQWITRNGLPITPHREPIGVLQQMALDPCADDWAARLVIDRGDRPSPPAPESRPQPMGDQLSSSPPPEMPGSPREPGRLF